MEPQEITHVYGANGYYRKKTKEIAKKTAKKIVADPIDLAKLTQADLEPRLGRATEPVDLKTAWYERCAVTGPFMPTRSPSVQTVTPVPLSSAEETQLKSHPCCKNMLNDQCTRDFGVDEKLRFR